MIYISYNFSSPRFNLVAVVRCCFLWSSVSNDFFFSSCSFLVLLLALSFSRLILTLSFLLCAWATYFRLRILTYGRHTNRPTYIYICDRLWERGHFTQKMNIELLTWCYSAYLASQNGIYHRAWSPTIAEFHALVLSHLQENFNYCIIRKQRF